MNMSIRRIPMGLISTWVLGLALVFEPGSLIAGEGRDILAGTPAGSGVIVHRDGYVLTAHHVVAGSRPIIVVTPGQLRVSAQVVASDQESDLALLKIDAGGLPEAPLGYAVAVRLDQEIVTAGYPFGLREICVIHGRVTAMRTRGARRLFQIDAAINPGNSGGAIFNRRGEVVGIVKSKFSHPSGVEPEGMAFAVPVSYATPLLTAIPGYDFSQIGRKQREPAIRSVKMEEVVQLYMVQTAVQIEIVRGTDAPKPLTAAHPQPLQTP